MLNKPKGYICANRDIKYRCISELIDREDCFCIGRLDIDTTGFVFMTNDKSISKKLSHPNYNKIKKYLVTTKEKINIDYIDMFYKGIVIDHDVICKPSILEIVDNYHCFVSLTEGKYHQIKRMFGVVGLGVNELERIALGNLILPKNLGVGQARELSEAEKNQIFDN